MEWTVGNKDRVVYQVDYLRISYLEMSVHILFILQSTKKKSNAHFEFLRQPFLTNDLNYRQGDGREYAVEKKG